MSLEKLVQIVRDSGEGGIGISFTDGKWIMSAHFGREAEDSPMVGGAAYGMGDTFEDALARTVEGL